MHYFFEPSEEAASAAMQATTDHAQWMQTEEFKRRDAEWTKRIAELTAKRDAGELYSTAKKDFTFTLSCSEQPYADKNSIFWSAVHYKRVNLTLNQFEKIIQRGFCFTSIFKQESFLVKDKTEYNWIGSQFVVFDLDNVRVDVNLYQFISALSMKPSVAYTTPNHAVKKPKENKAYSRFRLVYLFDSTIESKTQYQAIYDSIERDFLLDYFDNTKKKDNCGSSPVQQFSGNALPTCELIVNKESIYSLSSFPTEPQTPPERPTEPKQPSKKPSKPSQETDSLFRLNDTFFHDSNSMKPVNFIRKYINAYGIIEKPEIVYENGFYETTDDYVEIVRKFRKVYDDKTQNYKVKRLRIPTGERHNTLFAYAKLRCQIKPEISNEELFFNAVYDRTYFCDNDDKEITNECLIEICAAAKKANYQMKMQKRPKFKIDKSYCIAQSITTKQMQNYIRKKMHYDEISTWFDPTKSIAQNMRYAKENGIKISRQTLYNYKKERLQQAAEPEPQNPSPEQPPEPQKPSVEPSEALEQNEAAQSAPEPQKPSAKILEFIDFSEYRKKCKLYQFIFGEEATNKNHVFYNYERKQEEAASF